MGCGASSANAVEQVNVVGRKKPSENDAETTEGKSAPKGMLANSKPSQIPTKEETELEVLSTKTHSMSAALASGAHTGSLHDNYVLGKTLGAPPAC